MFTIDYVSKENWQVFFSSEYSSFRASFSVEEVRDFYMSGEKETIYKRLDVTVRNQAVVFVYTDGEDDSNDVVLDCYLTDDMCRELARLIEKEI